MVLRALRRASVVTTLAVGSLVVLGEPALAAPPGNDDVTGATAITSLPFTDEVDTTEATTTAEELAWNEFCGAPAMEHAVWYTATIQAAGTVKVDVTGSDYSAGILVLNGTPGAFTPVICMPGSITGPTSPGTQVYLMVFGDGGSPETGGTLRLEISQPVEAPQVDLIVDPWATVDRFGVATVTGTVACTTPDDVGQVEFLYGELRQNVGRFAIRGWFDSFAGVPCDGAYYLWSAQVVGDNGRFAGGRALLDTFAYVCGTDQCTEANVPAPLKLRRSG